MKYGKILSVVAILPFAAVIPHWIRVLIDSPVDCVNLTVYGLTALGLGVAALVKTWKTPKDESRGVPKPLVVVLGAFLAAFAAGLVIRIWLVSMTAAVGCAWCWAFLRLGRRRALWLLPAFLAFVPAVPSVLFWGERIGGMFEGGARPPCVLDLKRLTAPADGKPAVPSDWLVRRAAVNAGEKALFRTSEVVNWDIAAGSVVVRLSEVTLGDNVHEVHPLSFCLKSQGRTALGEKLIRGGDPEVVETITLADGRRMVVWTWYTGTEESTASFVRFRLKGGPGWRRYTLIAPDAEGTREIFKQIISHLAIRI